MRKISISEKIIGSILLFLIKLNYLLPRHFSYYWSLLSSRVGFYLNTKMSKVISENIELCFPQLNRKEKKHLIIQYLKHHANMSKETAVAWLGDRKAITQMIDQVSGQSTLEQLTKSKQPVIIAVPHIGNWEYFWQWLQMNYSAISMYSPAKFKAIDDLMLNARTKFGGRPFATDKKGLTQILKGLKKGSTMMILPDQAPHVGAGNYAPFFSHPAYTMTLLHKLMDKTKAQLLFATCLRNNMGGFDINITKPDPEIHTLELASFNHSLNTYIEALVKETPEQYLWNYKRFKRQPSEKELYSFEIERRIKQGKQHN